MGTFLRIVGIIVMIFGIAVAVFSILGLGSFIQFFQSSSSEFAPFEGEEFPPMQEMRPWMWMGGAVGAALAGFGTFVGGAALFCLGSIYNEVRKLRG